MKKSKGIKLNMDGYRLSMTQQEKIARLFELAEKINVQVGNERKQHDRNDGVLFKRS